MPALPTTEGTIVAHLRLDSSAWDAKLDEAEQRARDVGRLDLTITVHADVADAISKMEASQLVAAELRGDWTLSVMTVLDMVDKTAGKAALAADSA